MGRRGENIHFRKREKRWEARVVTGPPVNGKTQYKSLYGRTYREARQKKQAFMAAMLNSPTKNIPPKPDASPTDIPDISFSDAAKSWLGEKKAKVKESTYAQYSAVVSIHLLPGLGSLGLKDLTTDKLNSFLNDIRLHGRATDKGPLSDKTVSDIRMILLQVLRHAVSRGMMAAVPGCESVRSRNTPPGALTRHNQQRLLEEVRRRENPFVLGVMLSLYASLRIGEACGVKWGDLDVQNQTISIKRTVMRIPDIDGVGPGKTKVVIGSPKTDCSRRTIPLPEKIFSWLMRFRRPDDCYIMTGTTRCMEPRACRQRFYKLLDGAGIPRCSYHTLRHTYATRCIENGVDIKSLSEMMGHSDVKITMQRYVHPSMDSKKEQIRKLPTFCFEGQASGR